MSVTYSWRPSAFLSGDPQVVGEALEAIEREGNGGLTPQRVVEKAADDEHPLHPYFEWDNQTAADTYRLHQARRLVGAIQVRIERRDTEVREIRAFVHVETDDDQGYVSTFTALRSTDLRKQVIARAWAELEAWRKRHAELSELGEVFSVVDKARPLG